MGAPAHQSSERRGRRHLLQLLIGLLIVAVSVASAIVTWRAAEAAARATDLDARTRQAELLRSQRVNLHRADVAHDERLAAVYLGHLDAAAEFEENGRFVRAQEERAVVRALQPMFLHGQHLVRRGGSWTYRRRQAFVDAVRNDRELLNVKPAQLKALTEQARDKRVDLILVDTAFIASLFILTLAQLARQRRRPSTQAAAGLAGAGALLAVVATVSFLEVGW
jgi:hypothetical protein